MLSFLPSCHFLRVPIYTLARKMIAAGLPLALATDPVPPHPEQHRILLANNSLALNEKMTPE
jgi:imidazolonepropionase